MELKASKMLKVVSILLIIFGGIGFISGLGSLVGVPALVNVGLNPVIAWGDTLLAFVKSACWLAAGIMGVVFCRKAGEVNAVFMVALVMVSLSLLSAIVSIVCAGSVAQASLAYTAQILEDAGLGDTTSSAVTTTAIGTTMVTVVIAAIIGLILPILYLYASIQNKSSADGVQGV